MKKYIFSIVIITTMLDFSPNYCYTYPDRVKNFFGFKPTKRQLFDENQQLKQKIHSLESGNRTLETKSEKQTIKNIETLRKQNEQLERTISKQEETIEAQEQKIDSLYNEEKTLLQKTIYGVRVAAEGVGYVVLFFLAKRQFYNNN